MEQYAETVTQTTNEGGGKMNFTSFSVFHTEATVSIGLKKRTRNGNIPSTKLDVYAEKQSASIK